MANMEPMITLKSSSRSTTGHESLNINSHHDIFVMEGWGRSDDIVIAPPAIMAQQLPIGYDRRVAIHYGSLIMASEEPFRVHIQLHVSEHESSPCDISVPLHLKESFSKDGFVVLPRVFDRGDIDALNDRLEEVLRGRYDRNQAPDKSPRLIKNELLPNYNESGLSNGANCRRAKSPQDATYYSENDGKKTVRIKQKKASRVGPLGFSGNYDNVRVLQVINVHKCDRLFRSVAVSQKLGKLVAELAGWQYGARLAQDQVWAKPPGGKALAFHQDSPYFMFDPPHVVTVWIALDDMKEEVGPIEYVRGSHLWGDGTWKSSNEFFEADGGQTLLRLAADSAGVTEFEMISVAGLAAGGISVHDGRTWHGSGKNESKNRPRRGLGLHYVPAEVRFTRDAWKSRLWGPYIENVDDLTQLELPEEDFPLVWQPPTIERGQEQKKAALTLLHYE
jgi:ectoine hydroxylase-related dioxygenase (phytanoyl-CoA dioxygenase family)